jgi:glucan phosphoethanolaminetransferase (alkaline phosphatase superfamily)
MFILYTNKNKIKEMLAKQIQEIFKSFTKYQWFLLILFIVYFIFPIRFPDQISQALSSMLGLVFIFCMVTYFFFYSHPILGVFSVLAFYEFFRKNGQSPVNQYGRFPYVQYSSEQKIASNPLHDLMLPDTGVEKVTSHLPTDDSIPLEVLMVDQMAPIGQSDPSSYVESNYKPVADPLSSASMFY